LRADAQRVRSVVAGTAAGHRPKPKRGVATLADLANRHAQLVEQRMEVLARGGQGWYEAPDVFANPAGRLRLSVEMLEAEYPLPFAFSACAHQLEYFERFFARDAVSHVRDEFMRFRQASVDALPSEWARGMRSVTR
jgi:hypothetical protein